MRVVVIIPCYNEAEHIGQIVDYLVNKVKVVDTVIVSDDCSIDRTVEEAARAGAKVGSRFWKGRRGYGSTVRRGVALAESDCNPDILVFMDGDSQHSPEDIERLIFPIINNDADVVLGNRFGIYDIRPFFNRWGNRLCTLLANIGVEQKVDDAVTGYWAIRGTVPETIENGWGYTLETLMKCRAKDLRVTSVPVQALMNGNSGQNHTINQFVLGVIVVWKIIKWRVICQI